ncbi:hypothetical protein SAMN04244560_02868 [Thermoanaerobacter thermohydrosulfuricus]|uniref:Uncharacterized protein n=1 Tax=Thermoanaerobacter thermohydrosulfuricus TaxID=1516 RepID=A0A1G7WU64_THETY|nr:hypothetical protein [Thermoanaerobacter thermohydrosulfuricus]SDG75463.1 hypothetical protein SAMN04244560_02868 [Thermoanaerobacter thermohydrosulfuricus]
MKSRRKIEPNMCCNITDAEIFGLRNAVEPVVDKKINEINSNIISNEEIEAIERILEKWDNKIDVSNIDYFSLERKTYLSKEKIQNILEYLYLEGKYQNIIEKIREKCSLGWKKF